MVLLANLAFAGGTAIAIVTGVVSLGRWSSGNRIDDAERFAAAEPAGFGLVAVGLGVLACGVSGVGFALWGLRRGGCRGLCWAGRAWATALRVAVQRMEAEGRRARGHQLRQTRPWPDSSASTS